MSCEINPVTAIDWAGKLRFPLLEGESLFEQILPDGHETRDL